MAEKILSVQNFQFRLQRFLDSFFSVQFHIILIILGVILRLKVYFKNNSFWLDEAWVALDISTRTFSDIFSAKILSSDLPTPPPVFSLIEKLFITLFGNNEYIFRLFPLLCGIASLFLFYGLLRKFFDHKATSIVLIFFVCSDMLIYHSSELKQYSSGVLTVLVLYYLMGYMDSLKRITIRNSIGYGIAGGIAITLFYPSIFILAGIGTTQIIGALRNKDWERFKGSVFSAFLWLVIFTVVYLIYCYYMFYDGTLKWPVNPYPIVSFKSLKLSFDWVTKGVLVKTIGLAPYWLGVYFILIGSVFLLKKDKKTFFMLALPVFFVFLALILKKYPMQPRFFLAILPGVLIIFGYGAMAAMQYKRRELIIFNGILLGILLFQPLRTATHSWFDSHSKEDTRSLMKHLKHYQQPGDALFLNNSAQYAYGYYMRYFQFTHPINPIMKMTDNISRDNNGQYVFMQNVQYIFDENSYFKKVREHGALIAVSKNEAESLGQNKRTWILLSHISQDTKEFILSLLDHNGVQLKKFEETGAALYLYDLSAKGH